MRRAAIGLAAATAMVTAALAPAALAPAWAFEVGPAIGKKAPPVTARDAAGAPATLRGVTGRRGVVLVFFRSAKWCPFCQAQLISLREAVQPLAERGFALAALSYDSPDVLAGFAKRRDIAYPLLSDQGSVTIDAFALRDPQYPPGHYAHGVPQPSIFVLAPNGTVLAKLAEEGYRSRPTTEVVLGAVDHLPN